MSWKSGSEVAEPLVCEISILDIRPEIKERLYTVLIKTFEDYDCDTLYHLQGIDPIFDKVIAKASNWFPPMEESEEDN